MSKLSTRGVTVGVAALVALGLSTPGATAMEVIGTGGNDTLRGTSKADTIRGLGGNDALYGSGGADKLTGGDGKDMLKGGPGADSLYGLAGDDTLRARDTSADKIYCGRGRDTAYVDKYDLFPTAKLADPDGTCESIRWISPWVQPVSTKDLSEGAAGLDDAHYKPYPAIDLQAPQGSKIRAARGGYVEDARYAPLGQGWCGYGVVIRGVSGGQYIYCHMKDKPSVRAGQGIGAGRVIGRVGSTGASSGPHLHLQIWRRSMQADGYYNSVCPQPMLVAINAGKKVPRPSVLPSSGCHS